MHAAYEIVVLSLLFSGVFAGTEISVPDFSASEWCSSVGTGRIPDPIHCQMYFDCSVVYNEVPPGLGQHQVECPYPDLFSEETLQCEAFDTVKCADRIEPVNKCDYTMNKCNGPNCQPCEISYPKCEGLSDGFHAHPMKNDSPYYIECYKSRLIGVQICPIGSDGRIMFFLEEDQKCTAMT
ncbi:hypothetical protein ACJMK2_016807 [Sinanodonta woodiana]|uniref:Chitin-binding type-2 domain-containing protein n=1 Tax=Sinanodonta woodiana TaxID=1069815 RepID=A0ABD3UUX4_SINWO